MAHWAARASTIRLGSAQCILPLYHAARSLAEVGLVDTHWDGRLEPGIGAGCQQAEFERFGTSLDEAGTIFDRDLDVAPTP